MRVSVHLNLPNLWKEHDVKQEKITKLMNKKNVKILRLEKENIFEVTNFKWLGPSEIEQIQDVYDVVVSLIKVENKYPQPEPEQK